MVWLETQRSSVCAASKILSRGIHRYLNLFLFLLYQMNQAKTMKSSKFSGVVQSYIPNLKMKRTHEHHFEGR